MEREGKEERDGWEEIVVRGRKREELRVEEAQRWKAR